MEPVFPKGKQAAERRFELESVSNCKYVTIGPVPVGMLAGRDGGENQDRELALAPGTFHSGFFETALKDGPENPRT
jgi:hypothetical protein